MKTIIKYFCLLFLVGVVISCHDSDKEQFQLFTGNDAPYVRILLNKTILGKTGDLATDEIIGQLSAPSNNVDSYSLSVRVTGSINTDFVSLTTVNSFPTTVSFTTTQLANALGISLDDLEPADEFEFAGVSMGNGITLTGDNLAPDLSGQPEQRQAYDFSATVFCSPVAANFTGDWTLNLIDRYGDGWDGAFITATIDGVDTTYTVASTGDIHIVTVPAGSSIIWSYTSGAFEEEHVFTMTGPDGTVYGPFDGANGIPFCFF